MPSSLEDQHASLEDQHDKIYGASFSAYDQASMDEFVSFLAQRFEANNINPSDQFKGKRCLDAGCGKGRGALFMAAHGATHVDCVDISSSNVSTTETNLQAQGAAPFTVIQNSLESLPFPDETFDFVWCNGVLMHTANPDACLTELARVLKIGGRCWVYVYGADGLGWYWVSTARSAIRDFGPEICLKALNLMRLEARYVAEYIDDWTVPYLRTYSARTFSRRLEDAGFIGASPLKYGVGYDTSHRRSLFPEDSVWMGEGDLRFLLTKASGPKPIRDPLGSESENFEEPFNPAIVQRFETLFDAYRQAVKDDIVLAVATSASIQRSLRDFLSEEGRFDVEEFHQRASEAISLARDIRHSAKSD
jgi:ubiquinone/menaquinone biosynthesis C-methylase UbiE